MKTFNDNAKIVITEPIVQTGGVSQFLRNISPYFGRNVQRFRRGKRKPNSKLSFIFIPIDMIRFFIYIIYTRPNKVIINSSLGKVGILRDGFYVFLSNRLGIKTILYIHGFDKNILKSEKVIKLGYFQADKIFVLAKEFRDKLISIGYTKSIFVSYNPINNSLLNESIEREVKQSYDPLNLLMMSRIERSKGIFLGLELMRNLKHMNIVMNIAGTGSELENAKEFARINDLKNVIFHGFVTGTNKMDLLKKSDILFFPTFHNEGLPINVLEGLAMGLYVITRPVAGLIDLSEEYFLNIIDSDKVDDYQTIIDNILRDGLPIDKILENQSLAKIDFSPVEIINKILS